MLKDAFGLPVPQLLTIQDRAVRGTIEESHMILSYLLAALVVVHIAGALRHHFIKHTDVMRRMWFGTTGP
jgi:cytochrome b561